MAIAELFAFQANAKKANVTILAWNTWKITSHKIFRDNFTPLTTKHIDNTQDELNFRFKTLVAVQVNSSSGLI